jgi:hypothetical protein
MNENKGREFTTSLPMVSKQILSKRNKITCKLLPLSSIYLIHQEQTTEDLKRELTSQIVGHERNHKHEIIHRYIENHPLDHLQESAHKYPIMRKKDKRED